MGNLHSLGARFLNVDIHIPLGVNDGTLLAAGKQVGTMGNFLDKEMF